MYNCSVWVFVRVLLSERATLQCIATVVAIFFLMPENSWTKRDNHEGLYINHTRPSPFYRVSTCKSPSRESVHQRLLLALAWSLTGQSWLGITLFWLHRSICYHSLLKCGVLPSCIIHIFSDYCWVPLLWRCCNKVFPCGNIWAFFTSLFIIPSFVCSPRYYLITFAYNVGSPVKRNCYRNTCPNRLLVTRAPHLWHANTSGIETLLYASAVIYYTRFLFGTGKVRVEDVARHPEPCCFCTAGYNWYTYHINTFIRICLYKQCRY